MTVEIPYIPVNTLDILSRDSNEYVFNFFEYEPCTLIVYIPCIISIPVNTSGIYVPKNLMTMHVSLLSMNRASRLCIYHVYPVFPRVS
jgi:hypothetical protein